MGSVALSFKVMIAPLPSRTALQPFRTEGPFVRMALLLKGRVALSFKDTVALFLQEQEVSGLP